MKDVKSQLRRSFLQKRSSHEPSPIEIRSINFWIRNVITSHSWDAVAFFAPYRQEPDIWDSLDFALGTHRVFLPVVSDHKREMRFWQVSDTKVFCRNKFGILEPTEKKIELSGTNVLVLVPMLSVDRDGYRLGYGGGFYDKFIATHPEFSYFGVLYDRFVVKHLPHEPHDRPLHGFITESGLTPLRL